MFITLLKKQMTELFRGYFVNRKTGKIRTKKEICLFLILFLFFLCLISSAFTGITKTLAASLIPLGYEWLYFSLLGILSMALGIFGSVFSAYSMLYLSKDNDMLLSMPIRPSVILDSRIASAYILNIIYEAVIYVPALVEYWRLVKKTPLNVIFPLLNLFISGLVVLALTCLFGWVIAFISTRIRNKNIITVVFSLIVFGIYYLSMFRLNSIIFIIANEPDRFSSWIYKYAYPMYSFGMGNNGNVPHFLLFAAIALVLFVLTRTVLSKTFIRFATANKGARKKEYRGNREKERNVGSALFAKEVRRFLGLPVYLLNSGLGILIGPVASLIAFINRNSILPVLDDQPAAITTMLPAMIISAVGIIYAMDNITAPSVSLEGKSLWILRTLPVDVKKILAAKIRLHFTFNSVPAAFTALMLSLAFGLSLPEIILIIAGVILDILLCAGAGLMFNLLKPDFMWTNETIPVKQDPPLLMSMFFGFFAGAAATGIGVLLSPVSVYAALCAVCLVYAAANALIIRWIFTRGVRIFNSL